MSSYGRENQSSKATLKLEYVFAEGAFKNVHEGSYVGGPRNGQRCVGKIFKSGSVFKESFFDAELKVVEKALEIINQFNDDRIINKSIWLNKPTVWTFDEWSDRSGEKVLVEPMISNFEKFNSNTAWTPQQSSPWIDVMQALSHYSFHISNATLLFCDLQGGVYKDGFVITDPVIMSMNQEYGPTDLGSKGISTFFSRHKCNTYCESHWMTPADKRVYFKTKKGSSMVLPTRFSRDALTAKFGNNKTCTDRLLTIRE